MRNRCVVSVLGLSLSIIGWLALPGLADTDNATEARAAAPTAEPATSEEVNHYRLPQDVVPSKYTLKVIPNKAAGTFSCEEQIEVELKQKQESILLNSVELSLSGCTIEGADKKKIPLSVETTASAERVKLTPAQALAEGKYRISLKCSGHLNKQLRGLYGATAKLEDKTEATLVATQFEPTDARRMFPCFDEPAFKASFSLSALIDSTDVAISNSPVASEKPIANGHKLVSFTETPKMSTYLLALFVGPFRTDEAVESDGVKVRVWSVGHPIAMGNYARDLAAKLLPFFHEYFGIAYPESKLDLVALPDFEAGAMENLGAISFRETLLLRDDAKDSLEAKMSLASVVAHEMSHMWFGDLVTMKWWDDLWLNEAFATWMSHKAIEFAYPEWQTWEHLAAAKNASMETDALGSSRAIHADVKNPADAFQMFDEITYSKGASIIRMLEQYVSVDKFRAGVRDYLAAHQFSNATTEDLWSAVEHSSEKPISTLMHDWVYQPGFPLVSVDGLGGWTLLFAQSRFYSNPSTKNNGMLWHVPIGVSAVDMKSQKSPPETVVNYSLLTTNNRMDTTPGFDPISFNANGAGYYRALDRSLGGKTALSHRNSVSPNTLERYTLLTDQWACVRADKSDIRDYLTRLLSYGKDKEPFIIETVCDQFEQLWALEGGSDSKTDKHATVSDADFSLFVRETLRPAKAQLGWRESPDDSDSTKRARNAVLRVMGTIGQDPDTIREGQQYFADYLIASKKKAPFEMAKMLGPIESIVAYNGDATAYALMIHVWKRLADTPSASKRALFCLSLFRQKELVEKTLSLTLDPEVKIQDAPVLLAAVMSRKDGVVPGLRFVEDHWEAIKQKYPPYMLPGIISAAKNFNTTALHQEFVRFFEGNLPPECSQAFDRTVEEIDNNLRFVRRQNVPFCLWLNHFIETQDQADVYSEGKENPNAAQ